MISLTQKYLMIQVEQINIIEKKWTEEEKAM